MIQAKPALSLPPPKYYSDRIMALHVQVDGAVVPQGRCLRKYKLYCKARSGGTKSKKININVSSTTHGGIATARGPATGDSKMLRTTHQANPGRAKAAALGL